jgi:hypothetical protein
MPRKKITNIEERKSRLAIKIQEWWRKNNPEDGGEITFSEIIDKHFITGQSTDTITTVLQNMVGKEFQIARATLGAAVRLEINRGNIKVYRIESKTKHNVFRKPGSGRPPKSRNKKKKVDNVIEIKQKQKRDIEASIHCNNCNNEYLDKLTIDENGFIGLQAYKCHMCSQFGTVDVSYAEQGQPYHKGLVNSKLIKGFKQEIFLEEKHKTYQTN